MFKKYLTLTLTVLVLNLAFGATAFGASTNEEKAVRDAEKVRANIAKLGTGKDARVEVKLKDGSKVKGFVRQINDNGFVVVDEKTAATTEVAYPNARQVKGNNLSTGAKIAIGVGILVLVIVVVGVIGYDS